jgi:RNA polymerase sigma-70 factor (ECF subfamily)
MTVDRRAIEAFADGYRGPLTEHHEIDLGPRLVEVIDKAAAAWPSVPAVDTAAFARFVAERLPTDRPVLVALEAINAPELWLVHACLQGQPESIAQFHAVYLPLLEQAACKILGTRADIDDLLQNLCARLLVGGAEEPAKIRYYEGQGRLATWLRVVCARMAIDLTRSSTRNLLDDDMIADLACTDDLEIRYLKGRYREQFRAAFREALGTLSHRERNILRYHLGGLTAAEIGTLYKAHRVTVARWLSRLRHDLHERVREHLMHQLDVNASEADSIIRLVEGEISLSVDRLLGLKGS